MEAVISSFRRGRHTQYTNQMIINADMNKEKAKELIGKKVIWTSPAKKEIKGVIKTTHGNKGCLRVHFEKGMPGQSLGTKVRIENGGS
ncbi:50S ribosomal protein L35ae [Candidatus Woesearchaeota archaeon]|nr:50S ribosomal protein L35ae [Candidatus Woesearchaeota archaeon]